MDTQKITLAILACPSCGAPMHPDAGKSAFSCPYCGRVMPYSDHVVQTARPLKYKHRDVPMEDGLIKLIRVAVLSGVHETLREYTNPMDPGIRWARSFDEYVASIDRRAYVTRRDRFEFTFICSHCGGEVAGSSTQTMYECGNCGSVYGLDNLSELGLDLLPQIVGNQSMVPSICLAYKLGPVQAQTRVLQLVAQNPGFFAGFDVAGMLRAGMLRAVYTPASLSDLALRVTTDSNLGNAEFYMEWIDWVLPRDAGLDLALVDRMQPWDFNEAGPFVPDLVMGDVTICAATNFASKLGIINSIAAHRATEAIIQRFGPERLELIRWSHDLIEHQSGLIALPVFYLELHDGAGGGLRIMVNGQSGAAHAAIREDGRERFFGLPGMGDGRVDGERSMISVPVPVRYEKASHLYRVLTPQEAFGRNVRKMGGTAAYGAAQAQNAAAISTQNAAETPAQQKKKGLFGRPFG